MSNVAKLKKKAIEFEQKKQFDKALALYVQILEESEGPGEEADVALFNRVGDLMLRHGQVARALDYYERAVDLYAEGGFFNNAIALCNKILRNSPGRSSIYYKLGKISAKKGFASDAKQNFLEYADRMQKAGQMDEAFRALKEFADLCPDQDDVRLMLAEQLSKRERKGEAMEQLQSLYEKFEAEGRTLEARATADRMRAIDPTAEPKVASQSQPAPKSGELVFLDVDYGDEPVKKPTRAGVNPHAKPPAAKVPPPRPAPAKPAAAVPPTPIPAPRPRAPEPEPTRPAEPEIVAYTPEPEPEAIAPPRDLEPTRPAEPEMYIPPPEEATQFGQLAGFETSMGALDSDLGAQIPQDNLLGIEPTSIDAGFGSSLDAFSPQDSSSMFTTFDIAEEAAPEDTIGRPEHDLVLPGELPMLDLPDFDSLDSGPEIPLIMPDDPMPPRRKSSEVLAELDPPFTRDMEQPPVIELEAFNFDIQKEDSALLSLPEPEVPVERAKPRGAPAPRAAGPVGLPPLRPPGSPGTRRSSALAQLGDSAEDLAREVAANDTDHGLRRRLGEALLERGERERGLQELELAMIGFERSSDYESARSVADEIIRLDPNSVRHHQKRVQYAFQANDTPRLVEAYLELADALFRGGQADKARTVYQRVLELAPNDIRAQAALSAFVDAAQQAQSSEPAPRGASGAVRRYSANTKRASAPAPAPAPKTVRPPRVASDDEEFVNLGDMLRDDEPVKSTRMIVEEQAPSGDEQADFADMLKRFKRGIAENVDEEDHQSHYDLGVAFKEMGLLDEAIAEFQKALRGSEQRIRTYEALGQCFLERSQFDVAATILQRALADGRAGDEQLVGVLYLLGYATEALDRYEDALTYYQRVFGVDIQFRDVADRIRALERVAQ
jgi:tetratricopeptide (TPR) repeat protein